MLSPKKLAAGSRVVVVSPSGPVLPAHLEAGVAQLEAWGFEVAVPDAVYARCERPRGYLAGEDGARLAALNAALRDDAADAILFARGGYGAMRLLPGIDWAALAARPKLLMGFSDITALLLAAWAEIGLRTLHGPVVKSFTLHPAHDDPAQTREQTRRALCGERGTWQIEGLERVAGEGVARGQLIGGNLCLMASLMGTRWAARCAGKIVFLEEVGEQDYRVDRLLRQLMLGWADAPPAAVILGDFTGAAGVYAGEEEVGALLGELGRELGVPVARGLPCGHGARNVPLPLGVEASLELGAGVLTVYGDCVHG